MSSAGSDYARLTDRDLLARVLGVRSASRLHRRSLSSLVGLSGEVCLEAGKLLAAAELVRRALAEQMATKPTMTAPSQVQEYLRLTIGGRDYEVFAVLFLDAQHALLASEEMFRGALTQTSVYPREVVKAALRLNAASVILAHNHPSGLAEPSRADEHLTQALKSALALVDVRVLDHIVVGAHSSVSFAERGLL